MPDIKLLSQNVKTNLSVGINNVVNRLYMMIYIKCYKKLIILMFNKINDLSISYIMNNCLKSKQAGGSIIGEMFVGKAMSKVNMLYVDQLIPKIRHLIKNMYADEPTLEFKVILDNWWNITLDVENSKFMLMPWGKSTIYKQDVN